MKGSVVGGLLLLAAPLHAQGYHVRLDTWFQSMTYRGIALDSVPASDVTTGSTGGFLSPDGIAARCRTGAAYCTFFRPGPERRGSPLVTTVSASVWGLGQPGLQIHLKGRAGADLADPNVWPGTSPAVQLLEGYAEYQNRLLTVQAGRTHVFSRLGWTGFDGAQATVRPLRGLVRVSAFGGWRLAEGVALPVTSPDVNPLADFRPPDREVVFGAAAGVASNTVDARVIWQREVNSGAGHTAGNRGAFDATLRPSPGVTISGGIEYDLAAGEAGTQDLRVAFRHPRHRFQVEVGGRRYRPYFPLWSIWRAFSPVAYTTYHGAAVVQPMAGLEVRTRGESYRYDDAEAETPLVAAEDGGWRWSAGAAYAGIRNFVFDGSYDLTFGPGASGRGLRGQIVYRAHRLVTVSAHGGYLSRPLEFRFDDATVWSYGARVDARPTAGLSVNAEVVLYNETRERPDQAQFDWNQPRINIGATLVFGSGSDSRGLHPAILRIPDARRSR